MRLLLGLLLVLAMPSGARAVEILSARPDGPVVAGFPLDIAVAARGGADGVLLTFPDLQGEVRASACGLRRAAGRARFALPYRPSWAGTHVLSVSVLAGACRPHARSDSRLVRLEAAETGVLAARAPRTRGCPRAARQPIPRIMRASRMAVVCLLARERAALGLPPLVADERLRRQASRAAHALVRGEARAARPGEQRTTATGELSAPHRVVATWMASSPLRRDLLDPAVGAIGVSVVPGGYGPLRRPGATYVVVLGLRRGSPAA